MTEKTQEPKQYWLQLREEGLRARRVRHVGMETLPGGDKLILLEADTWTGVRLWALERSKFDVDWRTWNRPPEVGWLRRAFTGRKEQTPAGFATLNPNERQERR